MNYIRPDEKPPDYRTELVFLLAGLALIACLACFEAKAIEYGFALGTPAGFKQKVRKTLRNRAETWIETPPVRFWLPGPLTFQSVAAAYVTTQLPGYVQLAPTSGEIYRRGDIAAWLYKGSRDFITISTRIGTSRSDMSSDLNYEIDLWMKTR